jgi:hypothetical protein
MKQWSIGLMSNDEKNNILDQHKTLYNGYKTMQPQVSNTQPLYTQDFANDKGGVTVNNKGEVKRYMNMGINEQVEKESMCSECGGMVYEGECMECGYSGGEMGEEMQQVKDLENIEDLNLSDKFDYTEGEIDELSSNELERGKKYKYKHPEFDDDLEYEDEFEDKHGGNTMYKFKSKDNTTHMMPNKSIEDFMDNLDDNDYRDMMAYSDEVEEQVGGGTAPSTNYSSIKPAYNFVSGGPLEEDGEDDMEDGEELYPVFSSNEFKGMSKKSKDMEDDEWEEIDIFNEVDEDLKESVVKHKNRIMEMMNRMKGYN